MSKVILNSNSGCHRVELGVVSPIAINGLPGFDVLLRVAGQYWDGDHDRDISLHVEGVTLSRSALLQLSDELAGWLQLTVSELAATQLVGEYQLALDRHQSLFLKFGNREQNIADINPAVSIQVAIDRLEANYCFITDHSCLGIFQNGLWEILDNSDY